MADHSLPVLTSTYANFVSELDARFDDLAVGLDPAVTTSTNLPANSIRWSSTGNTWQKWNGSTWSQWTNTLAVNAITVATSTVLGSGTGDTVSVSGYAGIGTAAVSSAGLTVGSNALTGTVQIGASVAPVGTSNATSGVVAVQSTPKTAAGAFTASNAKAFEAVDALKGAGSTITNQYGVFVNDQTQGTNNFGAALQVSSGANKWNVYASGTASNAFAGNVKVGATTAPAEALDVNGNVRVTSGNSLQWGGSAYSINGNTSSGYLQFNANSIERLRIDGATGKVSLSTNGADIENVSSINGGQLAGFKSAIINGNFSINQLSVTGTVVLAAGQYGHDMWKAGASGCTYTFNTVNNVTTITITAGSLQQVIEGLYLYSCTYVLSWQGTAQGKIASGSYSASGVTATATGGTDLVVEFGTGTLSKVQFEQGTTATPYEDRLGMEFILCQRYVQTIVAGYGGPSVSGGNNWGVANIPIRMRAVPTVTWMYSLFITNFTGGAPAIGNLELTGFRVLKTANGTASDSGFMERLLLTARL